MRIGLNPITGDSMLAAAREWLGHDNHSCGRTCELCRIRRPLLSQRFIVLLHGGQYTSKWQVKRSGTRRVCEKAFKHWCEKAPRSFVGLVACPWVFDSETLQGLGFRGADEQIAAFNLVNSKLRIFDSRLPDALARRHYPNNPLREVFR